MITFTNHSHGNTLNLIIQSPDSPIISSIYLGSPFSDQLAIFFSIYAPKPTRSYITRTTRRLHLICTDIFAADIDNAVTPDAASLDIALTDLLNHHSPPWPSIQSSDLIHPGIRLNWNYRNANFASLRKPWLNQHIPINK